MKTVDFSETIAASDLKGSIEGQGHFFTIIGPLVYLLYRKMKHCITE